MKKLRYFYRLLIEFILRFKIILGIGVIMGFFIFIIIRFTIPSTIKNQTERVGIVGRYTIDNLPENILYLASNGLTFVDENDNVLPALADSWNSNSDGKEWVFRLKDGLFWQDGTPIISQDIKYNFSDVEVEYPDSKTIIFKLSNPYTPFPVVVSRPIFKHGLLGNGNWKVAKISQKSGFVESLTLKSGADKKIINFYPSEEDAKIAYKLGRIDTILELLDPTPFDIWNNSEVISTVNHRRYVAIFFNQEDELVANKSLRQALAYGLDKKKISPHVAYGPISPDSWAYNPQIKKYEYNKERALELLNELSPEELNNLNLKLATIPILLPVAEQIADQWRELGIDITVQVASLVPENYQAFMAIFDIPKDPDQYQLWHSTQTETNIANYSDLRIDKLLESGRFELNKENRKKIYLDFQRFLLEDIPAVFLYYPVYYTVIRK